MMRLLYSPTSPYARKVRVVAIEKGLADRIALVPVNPLCDDTDELHCQNPLGKVPALVLDDGRAVVDSPVICEQLDALASEPQLIPKEPDARIDAHTRQAVADGVADAAFNLIMEARRPDPQRSPQLDRALAGRDRTRCRGTGRTGGARAVRPRRHRDGRGAPLPRLPPARARLARGEPGARRLDRSRSTAAEPG